MRARQCAYSWRCWNSERGEEQRGHISQGGVRHLGVVVTLICGSIGSFHVPECCRTIDVHRCQIVSARVPPEIFAEGLLGWIYMPWMERHLSQIAFRTWVDPKD